MFAMSGELRRNIELKARLRDAAAAHATARRLATVEPWIEWQTDTYFAASRGRLKLREICDAEQRPTAARLVAYSRPDDLQAKASDYRLLDVPEPRQMKELLATALGVTVVVEKRRTIYLHHNVRIHLDEVAGLGAFLEFEAVLDERTDDAAGHAQLARLREEFKIVDGDLLARSYSDLQADKSAQSA